MKRLRHIASLYVTLMMLVFPVSSHAFWGEGTLRNIKDEMGKAYSDTKEDLGDILDFTEGALEVGWEGIYGAGCGVKNLATWDGTSCSTSVKQSGDQFRSLIRDVDDCIANADPTTLLGMAAEETVNAEETGTGLLPGEVETLAGTAGQADLLTPAMQKYLQSPRGAKLVANLPGWQKVSRKLPVIKYVAAIVSLTATCGSTLDFLDYGIDFGLGQGPSLIERDGVWMECQWECVPKLELNTAECNARATSDRVLLGAALPAGSGYEPDEVRCTGPMEVRTTERPATGAGPARGGVDPTSVPGGAMAGTCAKLIRDVASSGSTNGQLGPMLTTCLGTADSGCHVIKAKAAAGHPVFPMLPSLQQRCFA